MNALVREAAPDVIRAVIERALAGDMTAANLILARTSPPLRPIANAVMLEGPTDSPAEFVRGLLRAAANGCDPHTVAALIKATADAVHVIETTELEGRVRALEKHGS